MSDQNVDNKPQGTPQKSKFTASTHTILPENLNTEKSESMGLDKRIKSGEGSSFKQHKLAADPETILPKTFANFTSKSTESERYVKQISQKMDNPFVFKSQPPKTSKPVDFGIFVLKCAFTMGVFYTMWTMGVWNMNKNRRA